MYPRSTKATQSKTKKRKGMVLLNSHKEKDWNHAESADTKALLIRVAKSLFAKQGYDGTTVKDIADAAKMNISLISYHFSGKEGLYRACLEQSGKARLAAAQRILHKPKSIEEFKIRLQMFVEELLICHVEDPDFSQMMSRECASPMPMVEDIFRDNFLKVYETILSFFKEAQENGLVRKDLKIEIVAGLFFGGIIHMAQHDHRNKMFFGNTIADKKYLASVIQNSILFCLEGCVANVHSVDQNI